MEISSKLSKIFEKIEYPLDISAFLANLPITQELCAEDISQFRLMLVKFIDLGDEVASDRITKMIIHLYYRQYKMKTIRTEYQFEFIRAYEYKLPRMTWNPPAASPFDSHNNIVSDNDGEDWRMICQDLVLNETEIPSVNDLVDQNSLSQCQTSSTVENRSEGPTGYDDIVDESEGCGDYCSECVDPHRELSIIEQTSEGGLPNDLVDEIPSPLLQIECVKNTSNECVKNTSDVLTPIGTKGILSLSTMKYQLSKGLKPIAHRRLVLIRTRVAKHCEESSYQKLSRHRKTMRFDRFLSTLANNYQPYAAMIFDGATTIKYPRDSIKSLSLLKYDGHTRYLTGVDFLMFRFLEPNSLFTFRDIDYILREGGNHPT